MRVPNPRPVLDEILHPWVLECCPALGLGLRHFFARTAWSQRKNSKFSKELREICARTFSEAPDPNILHKLCKCTPAQISHSLSTFSDAPAHLSHKISGTCRECPAHKFCTIFSSTWPVFKICLCTGNECLKAGVWRNAPGQSRLQLCTG